MKFGMKCGFTEPLAPEVDLSSVASPMRSTSQPMPFCRTAQLLPSRALILRKPNERHPPKVLFLSKRKARFPPRALIIHDPTVATSTQVGKPGLCMLKMRKKPTTKAAKLAALGNQGLGKASFKIKTIPTLALKRSI